MLCEERGSVLEVIVSRMKTLGTRSLPFYSIYTRFHVNILKPSGIRLIALSATVPNIRDVAQWLGDGEVGVSKPISERLGGAKTFM